MGPQPVNSSDRRIESWKKIASHFDRDERTVKRWEKDRKLPIRRMPGGHGGVFAYVAELDAWLDSSKARSSESPLSENPAAVGLLAHTDIAVPLDTAAHKIRNGRLHGLRTVYVAAAVLILIAVAFVRASNFASRAHFSDSRISRPSSSTIGDEREFYLMGKFYWNQRTSSGLKQAVEYFNKAIARNPASALAYAGLASTYDLMPEYAFMPNGDAFPKAIAAAERAIQLDPSLPEAHRALAFGLFFWKWDVARSIAEYQRAIALDPRDVESHHWYATELLTIKRMPESLAEIERARELDPTSRSIAADEAYIEYNSGNVEDGISKLRILEQSESDLISVHRFLATALYETKDFPGFLKEAEHVAAISNNAEEKSVALAARKGWLADGEHSMLTAMLDARRKAFEERRNTGFDAALLAAKLGKRDEAIRYLQTAFEARDYMLMTIADGRLDSLLEGDPAFEAVKSSVRSRMMNVEPND